MALVGEAHIIVRAITSNVDRDIQRGFRNMSSTGSRAGETLGQSFMRGFNRNLNSNKLTRFSEGLKTLAPGAQAARLAFQQMVRTGYTLGTSLSVVLGGVSSLLGGLGAIVGAAGGAAASLAVLGNAVFALGAAMASIKFAFGGIGKALGALNRGGGGGGGGGGSGLIRNLEAIENAEKALALTIERNREAIIDANNAVRDAQLRLNDAFKEGREEIQQLGFEAEDAALAEESAALSLEKAREELAAMADLPPNSRARREAELAFREADLNYRQAKDRAADTAAEQDRLASTGVAGTQVVIDATNALAEAEANKSKTVRDAARAEAEAMDDLADARKGASTSGGGGGGGGGADPFAGLNQAQIDFVKFIQSIRPQFAILRQVAAESFLPPLQKAITTLMTFAFPVVVKGIRAVSLALGVAVNYIADAIVEARNLANLDKVFTSSAVLVERFGSILSRAWGIIISVLAAAAPQAEKFFTFLDKKLSLFDNHLKRLEENNGLTNFFETSGDMMAKFGAIFGNIFEGLGAIIKANLGPGTGGGYLLEWLDTATQKFADLDSNAKKSANLAKYFLDASINAQKVASSIGALLKQLIQIGSDPAVGRTFDILRTGAPALGNIIKAALGAGPALAELVVQITRFIEKTTDTGAMVIFFETLAGAVEVLVDLLSNPLIFAIVTVIGQITAMLLAFGLIGKVGKFAFEVLIGSLTFFSGALGKAQANLAAFGGTSQVVGKQVGGLKGAAGGLSSFLGGPWALALATALVAVLAIDSAVKGLQASTEEFQNVIKTGPTAEALFKVADKGILVSQLDQAIGSVKDFKHNLDIVNNNGFLTGLSLPAQQFRERLNKIGEELGKVAATDLPAAQKGFNSLAKEYNLNVKEQAELLNTMPGLKTALIEQATQLGINVEGLSETARTQALLDIATGKTTAATDDSTRAYYDNVRAQLSANATSRSYEQAVDDFTGSMIAQKEAYILATGSADGYKIALDDGSQAGRDNQIAIEQMVAAVIDHAAAIEEDTGNQSASNQAILEGRDALIVQLEQFGLTSAEAAAYIDQLGLIPPNIGTVVSVYDEQAREQVRTFIREFNGKKISLVLSADQVVVNGRVYGGLRGSANGNMFNYDASGAASRIQSFASGGFPTGIFNGGAPMYKFAEPETRWEAFISGRRGQEERNRNIVMESARRLGMTATTSAPKIDINVTQLPGEDGEELAERIARKLAFRYRRGGIS